MEQLVLVRHAESEGNAVADGLSAGRDFWMMHPDGHTLTQEGRRQAATAGRVLREHGLGDAELHLVSVTRRAMETAALSQLSDNWMLLHGLVERFWGSNLRTDDADSREDFLQAAGVQKEEDAWRWTPMGGESLHAATSRALSSLAHATSLYGAQTVLAVTHGEIINGLCSVLLPGDPGRPSFRVKTGGAIAIRWPKPGTQPEVWTSVAREWRRHVSKTHSGQDLLELANHFDQRGILHP